MRALIVAGGTGGHINPGIAIANELKKDGNEILFVGTKNGMEMDLVPKTGYELKTVRASGIQRKLSLKNIKTFFELINGIGDSKKIIKEFNPDIVIGTGGYVTAPVMLAAIKAHIPTMIHESNALPGKTTKWLSSKVDVVAVGFKEASERLPKAKKVVVTGNPTKMQGKLSKEQVKEKLGLKGKTILVCGGSQGAKKINEVMLELINTHKLYDYNVIYATGPKHYEEIINKIIGEVSQNVKIEKYIYNMEEVMTASDLMIARSGAMTVTEMQAVGIASILIPFPFAAENHQYFNAKTLENVGAAKIILEEDLTAQTLINMINSIVKDEKVLQEMSQKSKKTDNEAIMKIKNEIKSLTFT